MVPSLAGELGTEFVPKLCRFSWCDLPNSLVAKGCIQRLDSTRLGHGRSGVGCCLEGCFNVQRLKHKHDNNEFINISQPGDLLC